MRTVESLVCVLVSAAIANAGSIPINHFTCHKVKDSLAKAVVDKSITEFTPPGAIPSDCQVKLPAKLACVPTAKDIVSPLAQTQTNPVVCYKVKCPKQAATTWVVTDQFGTHTLTAKSPGMLCAPACLPTGGSCLSNTTCCSGICTALVCL